MVQIFKIFNGANDISVNEPIMGRINKKFSWTFDVLKLFKDRKFLRHYFLAFCLALSLVFTFVFCEQLPKSLLSSFF